MMNRRPPAFAASIRWQSANVVSQVLLQLLFIMLLARLIDKADFGVMSIALVVVGFIEIFAQIGIGPSLIQREHLTSEHVRAALHFSLGLGFVFYLLLLGSSESIGAWFESPILADVLRWIAVSFILSSIALVPRSMLIRNMEFKRLFQATVFAMVIGNLVVGLGLAFAGYGIWAYVAALLSQNALLGLMYWFMRPEGTEHVFGTWAWADLASMLSYGGKSTLFNWFNYAASKADTVVVGEFNQSTPQSGGWSTTGVYDRSAHLMSLPVTVLGKLGDSVLFSGMSALQADAAALNRVVLRGLALIAWLIFPASLALAWFSEEAAVLVLGEAYAEAGPVVRVLFLGVAFRSLIKLADAVVRATDQLIPAIAIKALYLGMLAGGAWWALNHGWGILGVAWTVTVATLIQFKVMFIWLGPTLKISYSAMLKAIAPGVIAAALAIPGFAAIAVYGPSITDASAQFSPLALGLRVSLVAVWTAVILVAAAVRNPGVLDGNNLELRSRWIAYLPTWLQKHVGS